MAAIFKRKIVLASAILSGLIAAPAAAQIQTGQLSDASAFDVSLLKDGEPSLDSALWSDTSASAATIMIKTADLKTHGAAQVLTRAAVLSGGVPPYAANGEDRNQYVASKMEALLDVAALDSFDKLAFSTSARKTNPDFSQMFARRALLGGETDEACLQADTQTPAQRKEPFWAKLRAFCHVIRDEIPAAELTIDILRRSGHKDADFFALLGNLTGSAVKLPKLPAENTALNAAVLRAYMQAKGVDGGNINKLPLVLAAEIAADTAAPDDLRLTALKLAADIVPDAEFAQILQNALPVQDGTAMMAAPDLDADWTLADWASAYAALPFAQDSTVQAALAAAMLSKAEGTAMAPPVTRLLTPILRSVPAGALAAQDPARFARLAAKQRDLSALRGLYDALPDGHGLRARIALASDAIGGAFTLADLGTDIETRLAAEGDDKNRAIRDAYIAAALGSRLSGGAADILAEVKVSKGKAAGAGVLLALRSAANRGAKAEAALRAAKILTAIDPDEMRIDSLAAIIFALSDAGMSEQAGLLAAQDFLSGDYDAVALSGAP